MTFKSPRKIIDKGNGLDQIKEKMLARDADNGNETHSEENADSDTNTKSGKNNRKADRGIGNDRNSVDSSSIPIQGEGMDKKDSKKRGKKVRDSAK